LRSLESHYAGHQLATLRLDELPFYSEDLDRQKPARVREFLAEIGAADGLLICTPEYNHSIPGVLKNAIDWASRPAFPSPLQGKPVAIITQAVSAVGGARAQAHLKLVLDSTLSDIQRSHEMLVSDIDKLLDADLQISDERTLARLARHSADFIAFVQSKAAPA
jgi:chromate reductase